MTIDELIHIILANRGLKTEADIQEFFSPTPPQNILSPFDSQPAIQLIKQHISANNKIIIYGDYDVDGVCSTAILWETLHRYTDQVFPHIPHRREEGYGLSQKGLDHCLEQGAKLIIAVDNGITAIKPVEYCRSQGCDIIIIDHHVPGPEIPAPNVLLHSTLTCAAALSWLFVRDFVGTADNELLSLAALAVICDIVPLIDLNRSFAKFGLEQLKSTHRPGLLALLEEAAVQPEKIDTYTVGFVIGPRLNAMGRLEHALDSLRLLCTKDITRARQLAASLGETNHIRQDLTQTAFAHANSQVDTHNLPNILVVADQSYDQGIIGLIASKLTEKYYRPTIAISIGQDYSKGSARSVPGVNITDHLRAHQNLLTEVGGHAMAAGLTLETSKLSEFTSALTQTQLDPALLIRQTRVDADIPISLISQELYDRLQDLAPFGLGNPQPVFTSSGLTLTGPRQIGKAQQHLKFWVNNLEAICFNSPVLAQNLNSHPYKLTYHLDQNTFQGQTNLQLVVKGLIPV